ncbi:hypothetical protein [Pseudescherichia sp.]|uniref:hypothetical protein n=1 Tax=Pseudescherichia sp. TaxID=2055881 RepID=UPI002899FC28|nr:hypothetical protein [Pseudescherichia sp.]
MNFVYFKAEYPTYEGSHSVSLVLKGLKLLRDGEIIADFGDLKITSLPFYLFTTATTGFRKIEYAVEAPPMRRITYSCGYLPSGKYIVNTPDGEIQLAFNALTALWQRDKQGARAIDNREFIESGYSLIRPARGTGRKRPAWRP